MQGQPPQGQPMAGGGEPPSAAEVAARKGLSVAGAGASAGLGLGKAAAGKGLD